MERIKTFDELTIRDNFLFQHVMRNERLCKHLIEKFLNIQIRSLQYQSFEKTIAPSTLFTEGCPFTLLPIAVMRITEYN